MAEASKPAPTSNTVPLAGDHDRVAMLSLKADGTIDQHNPEIIVEKEQAEAAAKRQFAEQAVSAVDVAKRGAASADVTLVGQSDGTVKEVPATSDPLDAQTEALKKAHEDAAKAAESAAVKAVGSLTRES